jgi:hypothetical protein
MPNPWIIVGVLVAWLASLAAVGYWQNSAGHTGERVTWQAQQVKDLAKYNADILAKDEAYRLEEQQHAADLNTISINYQKELDDANIKNAALASAVRAGTLRLRDPGARRRPAGGDRLPETAARVGRCDASGDGRLSAGAAEFLLGLTGRCNAVRQKLTSCQAIVRSDRALHEGVSTH